VSYFKQVRPILQTHCQGCHQPARRGGEYVMTSQEQLLRGGESGEPAIVPGAPEKSELVRQIKPDEKGMAAMPKGQAARLSSTEIALIERWITEGAHDDSPASTRPQYDADHPPSYAAPPVITSLHYSPDGSLLAVAGYHEVLLHKGDGSGLVARLVGLSERIESAVFSPDGSRLAVSGGSPGRFGEIQVWQVAERKLLLSRPVGYDTCYGASWSPDGKMIGFGCADNTVRAIDAATGEQVVFNGAHNDWVLDTAFSLKSDHLVSVSRDMSMKLTEVATQRFVDNITSITPGALKGGLAAVDRHPTENHFLVGGADGAPKIFQMLRTQARKIGDDANLLRSFPALPGRVYAVAFSRDGKLIAAGSSHDGQGMVRVYQTADGKEVASTPIPGSGVFSVTFNHDGSRLAAAGFDGMIRLIQPADGTIVTQFLPAEINQSVSAR
jgi:WD40 repeat protein